MSSSVDGNIIEYNDIKVDKLKIEAYVDDEQIDIELKQFEVLAYLMENKNVVISREKLLEKKMGINLI